MASPDDPDATVEAEATATAAGPEEGRRQPLSAERIELPVYRPRRRTRLVFWCAFAAAALVTALVVWLLLA